MGLGLPLLSALTVSQFRAVVAHEFGHYNGGDSRLAPLVYRARQAMRRTIENMDLVAPINIFIVIRLARWLTQKLLRRYMDFYLLYTSEISQWQEYRADELACRVSGSVALIDGMKRIQVASRAFASFWDQEVLPVLRVGYHPPIADGFSHFCQAPDLAVSTTESPNERIREACMVPRLFANLPAVTSGDTSYDSHPPLSARILAVRHLPSGSGEQNTDMAATLLGDLQEIELTFLEEYGPQPKGTSLKLLNWCDVGKFVMEPQWKKAVAQNGHLFSGVAVENLPDAVHRVREIGAQMSNPKGMLLTGEQRAKRAAELLGIALGLALVNCGWEIVTTPGRFALRCGDKSLNNMRVVDEMVSGKLTAEAWTAQCRALGIANLPLGDKAAAQGSA